MKTVMASAAVVLRFAVGGFSPGIDPSRLPTRMKRPAVAITGRDRLELSCGQIGQADQDRHDKPGHRDMLRHPSSRNPEHPEKIRNLKDGRMVLHTLPRPLCPTSYRTLE